jgi:tetratricopeptide (TPR) repeat protein
VEKILHLADRLADQDLQSIFAEAQRVKGLSLVGLGDLREAQEWLEKALHSSRSLGITRNIPILETELGVVHRRLGEVGITEQYYASALKSLSTLGNTGWKSRLLNNMGLLYHKTGRLEQAVGQLEEALKTAERSGYTSVQTNVLISLGDLLTDLRDFDVAYDYYDRALTLATHLGNSLYIFYASLGQARLHRLNGDVVLAIDELRNAEISQVSLGVYERTYCSSRGRGTMEQCGRIHRATSCAIVVGRSFMRTILRRIHFPDSATPAATTRVENFYTIHDRSESRTTMDEEEQEECRIP